MYCKFTEVGWGSPTGSSEAERKPVCLDVASGSCLGSGYTGGGLVVAGAGPSTRAALGGDGCELPPMLLCEAIPLQCLLCAFTTWETTFFPVVKRLYNAQNVPELKMGSLKHVDTSYPQ